MTIWLDNHLSPELARWIEKTLGVSCKQIRELDLARASDQEIFDRAKRETDVFVTKDRDFAELSARLGPPPAIILITLGNTSTRHLVGTLQTALPAALELVGEGEALVEIGGAYK